MPSPTPAPTESPAPTAAPVQVQYGTCSTADIQEGQRVWAEGFLVVPSGSYSRNATWYRIWLRAQRSDGARMDVRIPGGDKSNSMYFDGRTPRIKDNQGQVIPWVYRGGTVVYVTEWPVTVRGTWVEACFIQIETIE